MGREKTCVQIQRQALQREEAEQGGFRKLPQAVTSKRRPVLGAESHRSWCCPWSFRFLKCLCMHSPLDQLKLAEQTLTLAERRVGVWP